MIIDNNVFVKRSHSAVSHCSFIFPLCCSFVALGSFISINMTPIYRTSHLKPHVKTSRPCSSSFHLKNNFWLFCCFFFLPTWDLSPLKLLNHLSFCDPGKEETLFHFTCTETSTSACVLALGAVLMSSTGIS